MKILSQVILICCVFSINQFKAYGSGPSDVNREDHWFEPGKPTKESLQINF